MRILLLWAFILGASTASAAERTYYQILNVAAEATTDEIQYAFRGKAYWLHPDRAPEDHFAKFELMDVEEAYRVLSDPELRLEYDKTIPREPDPVIRSACEAYLRQAPPKKPTPHFYDQRS